MIECIFTIDYEIYGNGEGSLQELVYGPTERLAALFDQADAKFVNFVEALEFEKIERFQTDPAISDVRRQIGQLHRDGHEIALHLHPQWAAANFEDGSWNLDYSEYNLCLLGADRIGEIVDQAIDYLRDVVGDASFTPFSFRAGNWLFQPTETAAGVLAERGVMVDSSVFKGGRIHQHRLDYRAASKNGYHWGFREEVNVADPDGCLLELPIHTQMVPTWRMFTGKRVGLQRKSVNSATTRPANRRKRAGRWNRLRDFARPFYPLKFDFCRMTFAEIRSMLEIALGEDAADPGTYRPLVAIGHSKDLEDFAMIERTLEWLSDHDIPVTTLQSSYPKCIADA